MEVTRTLDTRQWKDFVDCHPQGNIFHMPEMFEVFARARGYQPELWAVLEHGEILALLVLVQVTLIPCLRVLTTRAISYGGLLCCRDSRGIFAARRLLEAYNGQAGQHLLFSELRNLHDQSPLQSVYGDCGFVYEPHLNYLIDLTGSPEEVFQHIGSRTRRNIRRGLRRGEVRVSEVRDLADVAICYNLIGRSYRHAHVPLADWSLFKAAFEMLTPHNMLRFYLAHVGDVPVAASAELLYRDTIYGWYSGVEREYGSYVPGDLLMWHVLGWGAENEYCKYDFGGAGKPGEKYGVRDFKAKFGGELVEFGRFTIIHAPVRLGLSKLGYLVYQWRHWDWHTEQSRHDQTKN
ncbi:MAG: GNAT family N-acetyltransferase [Anaerolineae bacterium]|nr:GNAT family N-acetyltransferase [Anaerolineae bacterium]